MSQANGAVPSWLAELGIKPGEYFQDSKPRAKRAMKGACFSPAARVHICLGLHTMGFQQELAVRMEAGKKIPLTPTEIAAETGLARKRIREYILELKALGLADIKGSTKGRVEIYAWASPRPVEIKNCPPAGGQFSGPDWLNSLLKRFRIKVPDDFVPPPEYIEAVEAAARGYKEAEKVLARVLKGPLAADRSNKEERNERNIEINDPSPPPPPLPTVVEKAEEEEEEPPYEQFKKLYPRDHFDEGNAKPSFEGLKPKDKRRCLERLKSHIASERWQSDEGRWIPLASNWLKKWDADPPPLIKRKAAKAAVGSAGHEEWVAKMRQKYGGGNA